MLCSNADLEDFRWWQSKIMLSTQSGLTVASSGPRAQGLICTLKVRAVCAGSAEAKR